VELVSIHKCSASRMDTWTIGLMTLHTIVVLNTVTYYLASRETDVYGTPLNGATGRNCDIDQIAGMSGISIAWILVELESSLATAGAALSAWNDRSNAVPGRDVSAHVLYYRSICIVNQGQVYTASALTSILERRRFLVFVSAARKQPYAVVELCQMDGIHSAWLHCL
jgi:hypothetical protein